jgi:hypothetical protein
MALGQLNSILFSVETMFTKAEEKCLLTAG